MDRKLYAVAVVKREVVTALHEVFPTDAEVDKALAAWWKLAKKLGASSAVVLVESDGGRCEVSYKRSA